MWIITNTAFVSIVQYRDDPGLLIVRGRFKGDVMRFLAVPNVPPTAEIETPDADYRFRAVVPRSLVALALEHQLGQVRYPNFKDSIKLAWRKVLAMRVWSIFHSEQERRARVADRVGG